MSELTLLIKKLIHDGKKTNVDILLLHLRRLYLGPRNK